MRVVAIPGVYWTSFGHACYQAERPSFSLVRPPSTDSGSTHTGQGRSPYTGSGIGRGRGLETTHRGGKKGEEGVSIQGSRGGHSD